MNNSKTDIIVIFSSYRPRPLINALVNSNEPVECSATAKNIGVVFEKSLSFLSHITATCKTAFFHPRNISKIRNFLTVETTKTIIHAFGTSKLDSLLYDQPKHMLKILQSVQNCAARLIYLSSKYNHVTPFTHRPPLASSSRKN